MINSLNFSLHFYFCQFKVNLQFKVHEFKLRKSQFLNSDFVQLYCPLQPSAPRTAPIMHWVRGNSCNIRDLTSVSYHTFNIPIGVHTLNNTNSVHIPLSLHHTVKPDMI